MKTIDYNKPVPIRFGELKPFLQKMYSDDLDSRSFHSYVKKRLSEIILNDPKYGEEYKQVLKRKK